MALTVTSLRARGRGLLPFTLLIGAVAGCGGSAASAPVETLETFAFVRDEASILSEGQRRRAESELREIAQRSGVFGVLVTAGENEAGDPPVIYRPIIAEVTALGGEALVMICTREVCGPAAGSAHTEGLNDAVEVVRSAPAPPGRGRGSMNRAIRDWLDYVEAVAGADR